MDWFKLKRSQKFEGNEPPSYQDYLKYIDIMKRMKNWFDYSMLCICSLGMMGGLAVLLSHENFSIDLIAANLKRLLSDC